jgi:hypothetical protein
VVAAGDLASAGGWAAAEVSAAGADAAAGVEPCQP